MNKRRYKGFTMVELLVAMAIIGMLIAVAIWGIGLAQQSARNTARKTAGSTLLAGMSEFYSRFNKQPLSAIVNPVAGNPAGSTACVGGCVRFINTVGSNSWYDVKLTTVPVIPAAVTGTNLMAACTGDPLPVWCNPATVYTDKTYYVLGYSTSTGYKVCVAGEDGGWINLSEKTNTTCP